jgi:hypothetical protein
MNSAVSDSAAIRGNPRPLNWAMVRRRRG